MLQRRAVLAALGSAMATTIVPINVLASTTPTRRDQLAELVGSSFRLKSPAGDLVTAKLVAFDAGPDCPGLDQFSIVFEGDDLADGIYELNSRETGKLPVSLMPSGTPKSRRTQKRTYFSLFV